MADSAETSVLFWIFLLATAATCLWMLRQAVSDRRQLLGLYPVFGTAWLYFYVYMALDAVRHLGLYLPSWCTELGQLVSLVCLCGAILGWRRGFAIQSTRDAAFTHSDFQRERVDFQTLWLVGFVLLVVGLYGFRSFSQSGKAFSEVIGYWYMSGHLVYPGATLCLISFSFAPKLRTPTRIVLFVAALSIAMWPFLTAARRGPFFTVVMVCLFTPALCGWWRPKPVQIFSVICGAGLVMLFMVIARTWVYATEDRAEGWSQAARAISLSTLLSSKSTTLDDNEYAYHCGAVATTQRLGLIQYGTGDLSLLAHWVPRRWWPGKPELGRGWMEAVEWQIPSVMGWAMINGGAIGGVASSFHQYGWLAPLFWFCLCYVFGRVYTGAGVHRRPASIASWVGILASMHWLIAQSFHDAFVPACIYQAAPWLVFQFAKRRQPLVEPRRLPLVRLPRSLHTGEPSGQ